MTDMRRRRFLRSAGLVAGAGIAGLIPRPAWAQPSVVGTAVSGANLAATARLAAAQIVANFATAQQAVGLLKSNYGLGVSALITIGNGTGANMTLEQSYDWHGKPYRPAPSTIGPGQIGIFLHVHTSGTFGSSEGCLVYSLTAPDGTAAHTLLGSYVPYSGHGDTCLALVQATPFSGLSNYQDKLEGGSGYSQWSKVGVTAIGQQSASGTSPTCTFTVTYA